VPQRKLVDPSTAMTNGYLLLTIAFGVGIIGLLYVAIMLVDHAVKRR
jgi:hypothetical protein